MDGSTFADYSTILNLIYEETKNFKLEDIEKDEKVQICSCNPFLSDTYWE